MAYFIFKMTLVIMSAKESPSPPDTVEVRIEGIGTLRNYVIRA
jgi:2-keto-4-pentenoate hydratase/2-oxohepta-3-ene-1,7-dioic acid hydratase in catechol pathway